MHSPSLNSLSNKGLIWRGNTSPIPVEQKEEKLSTGFDKIDALLNSNGWPSGDVIEVLISQPGIGELSLFTPWLKRASQDKKVAFINPPFIPNATLLELQGIESQQLWLINTSSEKDALWAQYQCLKSGLCCAVFMWHPVKADMANTRKLQLAAKNSNTLGIAYRSEKAANQSTLFPYRMHLKSNKDEIEVRFLKRRGGWETRPIAISTQPNKSQFRRLAEHQPTLSAL
ncbi:translesion DNA synthesis-associated protein ImuA [Marinomonas balearica]|uniref:Protein ImuA n=1 Tax=Marinomonas balearica TaxID=491947 RepID=A0A4R6M5V8_9GAMM|nr:translesion DNA synthesis-associated protein ImuA [Marinomonas balearica]TDO96741.1 protein ImuA [Marinomonas balearica]